VNSFRNSVDEGKQPRVMLEYCRSGTLFHGLRHMGLHDVFDNLRADHLRPALSPRYRMAGDAVGPRRRAVHAVQDFRLQSKRGNINFAAIFGLEALQRVRRFSPAEMALSRTTQTDAPPNEYVKTLKDYGYQWLLVQEHTVERPETATPGPKAFCRTGCVCRIFTAAAEEEHQSPSSRRRAATRKDWLPASTQPFAEVSVGELRPTSLFRTTALRLDRR